MKWRFLGAGGIFAVVLGAACWAPLAPTALAPLATVPDEPVANVAAPLQLVAPAATSVPRAQPVPLPPVAATPTALPTPFVVPTLTTAGQTVLASIRADQAAQWVKNHTETPLRSGPSDDSTIFTRLPQWSLLRQTDSRPNWLLVQYSGDGDTRQPGPGWVRASDVGAVDAPTVWLTSSKAGSVWSSSDGSQRVEDVPVGTLMEVLNGDISGTRAHVRLPGNGRSVAPSEGWVDGDVIARAASPTARDLPRAYPADLKADVRVNVPYRTQLDGSDYAGANCGPTVLGMALESFGLNLPPPEIRGQVLTSEDTDPADTDAGSFIWALANVAHAEGIATRGLYDADGSLHHWTADDIRASLRAKQPVIVQVVYRGLPGREDSTYYGDHYIIITGLLGDQFLYNDPIGGAEAHEAPGYDRLMTATQLQRAMRASDSSYAYSAFALSR
jgi:peptidase C39-like protein